MKKGRSAKYEAEMERIRKSEEESFRLLELLHVGNRYVGATDVEFDIKINVEIKADMEIGF